MTLLSVLTLIFAVFRFIFTRKQVTSINTNLECSFPSEKQINCIDRHLNRLHFIPVDSLMIHVSIKACAVWRTCKLCFSKASYSHSSSRGGGQTPEIAGLGMLRLAASFPTSMALLTALHHQPHRSAREPTHALYASHISQAHECQIQLSEESNVSLSVTAQC